MRPRLLPNRGPAAEFLRVDPWRKLLSLAFAVGIWWWLLQRTDANFDFKFDLSQAAVSGRPQAGLIGMRMKSDRFLVTQYSEPGRETPITSVLLRIAGLKGIVDEVRTQGIGFVVTPATEELATGRVDITADRLEGSHPESGRLRLTLLSPTRVSARIAARGSRAITLSRSHVRPVFPEKEADKGRIQWDNAEFQPAQVTVIGPPQELDALPGSQWLEADMTRVELDKLDPPKLTVRLAIATEFQARQIGLEQEGVLVQVPVRRSGKAHEFEIAPILDFPDSYPPENRARFRLVSPTTKVILESYSPELDTKLSTSLARPPAERSDWIRRHCRLLVNMADYAKPGNPPPTRFIIYGDVAGPQFEDRRDYRVSSDPVFVEERK